jgi:hypothetical protein
VWVKRLALSGPAETREGACQLRGCEGELRRTAGCLRDQIVPGRIEGLLRNGASLLCSCGARCVSGAENAEAVCVKYYVVA